MSAFPQKPAMPHMPGTPFPPPSATLPDTVLEEGVGKIGRRFERENQGAPDERLPGVPAKEGDRDLVDAVPLEMGRHRDQTLEGEIPLTEIEYVPENLLAVNHEARFHVSEFHREDPLEETGEPRAQQVSEPVRILPILSPALHQIPLSRPHLPVERRDVLRSILEV